MACVTAPWFLSIFINMLPWESGQVPKLFYFYFLNIIILKEIFVCYITNSSQSVGCASV